MNDRHRTGALRCPGLLAALWTSAIAWAPAACAQHRTTELPPPRFVEVAFGGPLDSIYNAEYPRLSAVCSGQGDACYREELDSIAVPLAPVWPTADAGAPVGWLVARLRTDGRWPYAALLFRGSDGVETTLRENLGDWGYGTTLALRGVRDGKVQPWLLAAVGQYWIGESEEWPGFRIYDGPFGLEGRLWRLGPLTSTVELPAGVYKILAVEGDRVRLRAEIPEDMACEPTDSVGTAADPEPVYEVPLAQLLEPSGQPTVEVAYPKGC